MTDEPPTDPRARADHHRVIKGRKWRVTDPAIPKPFESELVHELMDARRAVGAGNRADDAAATQRARDRVQDAKVALGERGGEWWGEMTQAQLAERLRAAMLALLRHRKPESTICPSDAARVTGGVDWRDLMDLAREVAFDLQRDDVVEVRSGGDRVPKLADAKGPLRIARGGAFVAPDGE